MHDEVALRSCQSFRSALGAIILSLPSLWDDLRIVCGKIHKYILHRIYFANLVAGEEPYEGHAVDTAYLVSTLNGLAKSFNVSSQNIGLCPSSIDANCYGYGINSL